MNFFNLQLCGQERAESGRKGGGRNGTLAYLKSALEDKLCPYRVRRHVYQTSMTGERFETSKGAMYRSVLQFQKLHAVSRTVCCLSRTFHVHHMHIQYNWDLTLSISGHNV
jgi:hypothetical protein